jgi:Uma2 family endonuclease
MSTLQEIKQAVKALSSGDRAQLLDWMAVNLDVGLFVTEPPMAYGAVALERDFYSIEQYLELEEGRTMAYEYVAGQIYAMAEPSQSHEIIATNLHTAIHAHLRGQSCRAHAASRRILFKCRGDDIAYRPDVWVGCGDWRNAKGEVIGEPRLVIEVLSPSTARIDRREKAVNYREIPSLEECVLVAQKIAQVTIYRRAEGWQRLDLHSPEDTLELRSVGLVLPVARIYEGLP